MSKTLCFGKGGLVSCVSRLMNQNEPIRDKYTNQIKIHEVKNLLLIAKDKNKRRRNISVSNVCMFLHEDF